MKLTQLRQIIKEEVSKSLNEAAIEGYKKDRYGEKYFRRTKIGNTIYKIEKSFPNNENKEYLFLSNTGGGGGFISIKEEDLPYFEQEITKFLQDVKSGKIK